MVQALTPSLSLCQGAMDVVELCYFPWRYEVHGSELSHQALKLLPEDAELCGQDGKHLGHILKFSRREDYHVGLYVYRPPHDLLHTGPFFLPYLEHLHAH